MYENVPAGRSEIHIVLRAVIHPVLVEIDLKDKLSGLRFPESVEVAVGMPETPAVSGHMVQPFFFLVEVGEPPENSLVRFHCIIYL